MGAEELAHHVRELAGEGVRADDEELSHILAVNLSEAGVVADLAEGRGQGQGIAAELGTASIGHVLALAADGKPREQCEEVAHGSQHDGNEYDGDDRTAVLAVATRATVASAIDEGVPQHAYCGCASVRAR